jgi:Flp pilus assembly protein TadG
LVAKLWSDIRGSVLVESTIMFPLFILVTLGTIDVAYMLYDWGLANKAAYAGAHRAIVSDPVASGITNPPWTPANMGLRCYDGTTRFCPAMQSTCTPSAGTAGTCTGNGGDFVDAAFEAILSVMQTVYGCADANTCPLGRQNVTISYASNDLGFSGQPNGAPLSITVSLNCMVHPFYFIGALMQWAFTPASGCAGPVSGWPIPSYATTLTSEDLYTN